MRVSSLELHQKLGQTIDRARLEPVVVTKHDRDHVVILAAETYTALRQESRKARQTGSLAAAEREHARNAKVPTVAERKKYLARLAKAVEADEKKRRAK
jgi:PHD/YefM family antitoxin component YafN of YafNO toxin-antitoxin module